MTYCHLASLGRISRGCMTTALLGCTALVAVSAGARAQDAAAASEETPYRLNPVTIQAIGTFDDDANSIVAHEISVGGKVATSILDTPASISVITKKEIEIRNAKSVEEILQYTPGIATDFYGDTDGRNDYYSIRGFNASTYRDGLTLGTMRGVREEPFAYERVEVLRGANSTLFGQSEPGGSINFVTKTPKFERIGETYLTYGSFNHAELGFDFGDVIDANQDFAFRITGKVQDSELEYDHSKDDEAFLMGGLTWQPTDATKLSVVVDYLKRDGTPNSGGYPIFREYDRSDFFGLKDYNYHDVERTSITGLLSHDFGGGLSLQANLRYSDLTDNYGYAYVDDRWGRSGGLVGRGALASHSSSEELIGNAILKYDTTFDRVDSSTLAGLEFRDATVSESAYYGLVAGADPSSPDISGQPSGTTLYQTRDKDYSTQSLFLQQNLSFDDRWIATVGLRHDWIDVSIDQWSLFNSPQTSSEENDFSETSLRAALTYKVNDEVSAYFSYVESVAPVSESSPQDIYAELARGEQYELGVKYQPTGTNTLISASIYELKKDNEPRLYWPGGAGTPFTFDLIDSRVRGLDLEAKAEITENLSVIGAYSYMQTEIVRGLRSNGTDLTGNELATAPSHMASIWVNYSLAGAGARGDMTFGLGARYIGSYYFNDSNDAGLLSAGYAGAKSEATTLLDAAFTYEVQDGTDLAINVSNLLDEQHVAGAGTNYSYNPGREIQATLRHRF
ncbi:TonB-dependent siderophore receptor [Paracoccus sp. MBLB3053]|uniref:TonB-dependent siderophore receptor n=1 Tax=Paracoccus aurantius TaxID=3073814 RepID=A0ABU2HVS9_9RHOB|nr:TonB-dependent siderophore receptor [Paracoccus sp. MBLB3053]MDS9469150.1 TonB-dependent siderophore receptor [Paracoccus sp. MBLB3053]